MPRSAASGLGLHCLPMYFAGGGGGGGNVGVIFQGGPDSQTPYPPSGYAHVYTHNQNVRPDLGPNSLTLSTVLVMWPWRHSSELTFQ